MSTDTSQAARCGQGVLVLASQSAQRRALLRQVGFEPVCLAANIDETPAANESAKVLVQRLASSKALACARENRFLTSATAAHEQQLSRVVLAADTVIELDGQILGKPVDQQHAVQMLLAISGREHQVHSGVCVLGPENSRMQQCVVTTHVQFGEISRTDALRYWDSGEPCGKAGSYAIQGLAARFVVSLSGSYSNVVGLPLFETCELLACAGLPALN